MLCLQLIDNLNILLLRIRRLGASFGDLLPCVVLGFALRITKSVS